MTPQYKKIILCAQNDNIITSKYNEKQNDCLGTVIALKYGLAEEFEVANMGAPEDSQLIKYHV